MGEVVRPKDLGFVGFDDGKEIWTLEKITKYLTSVKGREREVEDYLRVARHHTQWPPN